MVTSGPALRWARWLLAGLLRDSAGLLATLRPTPGLRPGLLADAGFEVSVDLLDRLSFPSLVRLDFLRALPLIEDEHQALRRIEVADKTCQDPGRVVHLPMVLVTATKR